MGSPKVLTILVEFSDSTFYMSNPKKSFNQYLNKEGKLERYDTYENRNYGSVRQYFKDMSGGKFTPHSMSWVPSNYPSHSVIMVLTVGKPKMSISKK